MTEHTDLRTITDLATIIAAWPNHRWEVEKDEGPITPSDIEWSVEVREPSRWYDDEEVTGEIIASACGASLADAFLLAADRLRRGERP